VDNFIGKEYLIAINTIKFDTQISTFNRLQEDSEYKKTLESIRGAGQVDPVYLDNGYCIDGRHRHKALTELGVDSIKVIDINPELSIAEKLVLSNRDLVSGRDLNTSQLAIQAFKFGEMTGVSKRAVALQFGVSKMQLTFAGEVKRYLPEAYQSLITTGKAEVGGKHTQSLQAIYRYINAYVKTGTDIPDKAPSTLDYDKLINTEKGKEVFWNIYNEERRPDPVLAEHLIQYVNLRFAEANDTQ
jgi:hypothetical protein